VYKVMSVKGKGKAVPLQVWSGPEGSSKLRFPDYMTTAPVKDCDYLGYYSVSLEVQFASSPRIVVTSSSG
jgi:hypothetical protein